MFFSEENNQKTFIPAPAPLWLKSDINLALPNNVVSKRHRLCSSRLIRVHPLQEIFLSSRASTVARVEPGLHPGYGANSPGQRA
jgi:hypothetical protein